MTINNLQLIANQFLFSGEIADIKPLGQGFINDTFIVTIKDSQSRYILQRKNKTVFKNVPAMMENIEMVTAHLKRIVSSRGGDPIREVLTVLHTKNSVPYFVDESGDFWAMCILIAGSVTYDIADSLDLCFKAGVGIGRFQSDLVDFDKPLSETIKGFHNIRWRFEQWEDALSADKVGRVATIPNEREWIESRRENMMAFWAMVERGELPMRVTHNDTKLSNVLFDNNNNVLCMIDLDTVMSSTSLNDFGDAIRSYTNTGAEDEKDLDKVSMDISRFEAFAKGYLSERKATLTPSEIEWLAFSALYITFEQTLRFLVDYLDGDNYWKTNYDTHNLQRALAQYKLLQSMEEQYDEMCEIIKRECL